MPFSVLFILTCNCFIFRGPSPPRESAWHGRGQSALPTNHPVKIVVKAQSCQQNLLSSYEPALNYQPEPDFLELWGTL